MTERAFASLWGLSYEDMDFLSRFGVRSRVMIACQLLFFRCHGRFPDDQAELDPDAVADVADQTGAPDDADWQSVRKRALDRAFDQIERFSRDGVTIVFRDDPDYPLLSALIDWGARSRSC